MSRYIAFEGVDGAGKSQQLSLLARSLTERDITPIELHEPSFGPYGNEIRDRAARGAIEGLAEQHDLFTADRRDHVTRKIWPLLDFVRATPGFAILQSRCHISAAAYQAATDDPGELDQILRTQEAFAPSPDLILVLDLPVELALARLERERLPDAFENLETLRKVRQRYMRIVEIRSQCVLIDATAAPETVASRIRDAIASEGERG